MWLITSELAMGTSRNNLRYIKLFLEKMKLYYCKYYISIELHRRQIGMPEEKVYRMSKLYTIPQLKKPYCDSIYKLVNSVIIPFGYL